MSEQPPPTVAVVEDDAEVREACIAGLARGGIDARGYASARAAVLAANRGELASVVLFDLHLNGESAFDAIRAIRRAAPDTLLIAFTGHAGDEWLFSALAAGCVGYILKTDMSMSIADAVRQAASGGAPMSSGIARRVLLSMHAPISADVASLSPREVEVLQLLADGYGYEQIAARLGIALSTVRSHVQNVYAKLGVNTKSEATARAVRFGLIR